MLSWAIKLDQRASPYLLLSSIHTYLTYPWRDPNEKRIIHLLGKNPLQQKRNVLSRRGKKENVEKYFSSKFYVKTNLEFNRLVDTVQMSRWNILYTCTLVEHLAKNRLWSWWTSWTILSTVPTLQMRMIITLSTLHTSIKRTFENSADPDDTARNEPSHQDLHCLLISFQIWKTYPFWRMG